MFQRDIDTIEPDDLENASNGLCYVPNFLYHQECEYLKSIIDQQIWRTDLKRRTQHYGARYDYTTKSLKFDVTKIEESCLTPLVSYMNPLFQQLSSSLISQIIVNEHLPGEKISPHTDASCFGPVIMTITLGTSAVFRMTRKDESFDLKPAEGDLAFLLVKLDINGNMKLFRSRKMDEEYRLHLDLSYKHNMFITLARAFSL